MALHLFQVNFKARDDAALGRFWGQVLGWEVSSAGTGATTVKPAGYTWTDPGSVRIDVIAVPDTGAVRGRAHIELASASAAHHAELVARLRELGAIPAALARGDLGRTALTDPEGNTFCVLHPRGDLQDTGPIAAVVVDCADPRAMARFWGEAMSWTVDQGTTDHARLRAAEGVGPCLEFVRTPHLQAIHSRIHLDLAPYPVDSQAAEVSRLKSLGATAADVGQGDAPWKVLTDPEGNQFCVLGKG